MKFNKLGSTGISVGEIGFGAEWMGDKSDEHVVELMDFCLENGVNFLDCWMSDPVVRSKLGLGLEGCRDDWVIQGHIGATWQNNQYTRTRDMSFVKPAFEDLLSRLGTDYIDFGMIHYVDDMADYKAAMEGDFIEYVRSLKRDGLIGHIGFSTHNPEIGLLAARNPEVELLMFSVNPAYDMFSVADDIEFYRDASNYEGLSGMDPIRKELYSTCKKTNTALTVMKGYAGGTLLDEKVSPFGVKLSPVQCIHYALSRPADSIFVGVHDIAQLEDALAYESASDGEKDFSSVLSNAPMHSYKGKCIYCGHCTPCSVGIDIPLVNKFYDLAVAQDVIPDSVKDHYNSLKHYAGECIACGDCLGNCPFDVDIIAAMGDARDLFGL